MERERLRAPRNNKHPRKAKPFCFKHKLQPREERAARLAQDREYQRLREMKARARHDATPADPIFTRLTETIAQCRRKEKQATTMLLNYLATGRTVIRERLP